MKIGRAPRTFQELIFTLDHYWAEQGCVLLQPYDMEVGAGTFHTATFLRAVGPEPWRAAYVQPSRRPTDGRYGENPFRLQHYYQYQVVIKPSPLPILDLYLGSLRALGLDPLVHDVRFVEDNWESPDARSLGPRLGGVAERHGDHAVHLLPAGRRPRLPPGDGRDHLRARAARHVPAGRREHLRHRLDATGRRAASPTATCSTRTRSSSPPSTSSAPTSRCCCATSTDHERLCQEPARGAAGAAGVRAGAQGLAHLQPAGCAARHLGHRAAALHPAGAHARERRGPRLLRQPRGARLSAAQGARRSAGRIPPSRGRAHEHRAPRFPGRDRHRGAAAESAAHTGGGVRRRRAHRLWTRRGWRTARSPVRDAAAPRGAGEAARRAAAAPEPQAPRAAAERRIRCRRRPHTRRARLRRELRRPARRRSDGSRRARARSCTSRAPVPAPRAADLLPGIVQGALDALPIPRRMHWGEGQAQFVRPVHWVVMLYGRT